VGVDIQAAQLHLVHAVRPNERDQRLELGRRGRERVQQHFSADEIARRTVALYEELCGSST